MTSRILIFVLLMFIGATLWAVDVLFEIPQFAKRVLAELRVMWRVAGELPE